jgi:hypothetical protein
LSNGEEIGIMPLEPVIKFLLSLLKDGELTVQALKIKITPSIQTIFLKEMKEKFPEKNTCWY